MQYYIPLGQERALGISGTILVVRPAGDPANAWPVLRRTLQGLDPAVGYVDLTAMSSLLAAEVRPWRLGASVFTLCGVLALVVAAVGMYSVLSYLVAQRTHEIGVRVALGATGRTIAALILRTGATFAAVGVVIGMVLAVIGGRWLKPLLFETSPTDLLVLGIATAAPVIIALIAGMLPARRATRVSPLIALRAD
jgi:ABC-type antimicrobial peptide transport system permease subunit